MQSRPAVTYSDLQKIMATTVKRGLIRSQLGDRDHTTKINTLLERSPEPSDRSGRLPMKVNSLTELQDIIQFHAFVNEFNIIMQGSLKGKSSVIAAREVETAINGSQQKWLADQWAPYFDLFIKSRTEIKHCNYSTNEKIHTEHLINLINEILVPGNDFNLDVWLAQPFNLQYITLEIMNSKFHKYQEKKSEPQINAIQLIADATNTNPKVRHTLQLAKLYEAYSKKINEYVSRVTQDSNGRIDAFEIQREILFFFTTLYRHISQNFNAFLENQGIYDEAITHYINAKTDVDSANYRNNDTQAQTLTPDHFALNNLLALKKHINHLNIITEENSEKALGNIYYLYFNTPNFLKTIAMLDEYRLSHAATTIFTNKNFISNFKCFLEAFKWFLEVISCFFPLDASDVIYLIRSMHLIRRMLEDSDGLKAVFTPDLIHHVAEKIAGRTKSHELFYQIISRVLDNRADINRAKTEIDNYLNQGNQFEMPSVTGLGLFLSVVRGDHAPSADMQPTRKPE